MTDTKTVDELKVGDLISLEGELWLITEINGDFAINMRNTDPNALRSENALFGNWKKQLAKIGYSFTSK